MVQEDPVYKRSSQLWLDKPLHCPPSPLQGKILSSLLLTQSSSLTTCNLVFGLQVYREASKRALEEILVSTAGRPPKFSSIYEFLCNTLLPKIWQGSSLLLKISSSLFLAFIPKMRFKQWLGPAGSAAPVNSLTTRLCCLLLAVPEVPQTHSRGCVHTVSSSDLIPKLLYQHTHALTQRPQRSQLLQPCYKSSSQPDPLLMSPL